ncbi:hypothetical protein CFP56_038421 [Quercus suber]|uniref:Uncharacterized protein n=1 Tax=Quercus suber TaxID=58331 RepID=A0AAW0J1W9_QUESU
MLNLKMSLSSPSSGMLKLELSFAKRFNHGRSVFVIPSRGSGPVLREFFVSNWYKQS